MTDEVIMSRLSDSGSSKAAVRQANPSDNVKLQIRVNEQSSSEVIYALSQEKLLNL